MTRSNVAQVQGYAVLICAPEQVWNRQDMVLQEIRAVLKRGRLPGVTDSAPSSGFSLAAAP